MNAPTHGAVLDAEACGGCGESNPAHRCVGCLHDFAPRMKAAPEPDDLPCPICLVPFRPDDLCATDITEGTCHAACLEGSAVVSLDTGEPADGPVATYRYDSLARPTPEGEDRSLRDPVSPHTADLHPETTRLVNSFAISLAHKLLNAERKYGYSDGWLTDDWEAKCRSDLLEHVYKGDPLDVAAYAAFCWAREWSTTPPAQPEPGAGELEVVAKIAAENAGKNAGVAPQLLFAHILWAMQDAGLRSFAGSPKGTDKLEMVGTVEVLDLLLKSGGETFLTREQEWALNSAIKALIDLTQAQAKIARLEGEVATWAKNADTAHRLYSEERTARLSAEADAAKVRGLLAEAIKWLRWARPLAIHAIEDHRVNRVKADHKMTGIYRSGTTYVGIYQSEVDEIEQSADFLAAQTERRA